MTQVSIFVFFCKRWTLILGCFFPVSILKVLLLMTDTGSGSLELIVISEDSCDCGVREVSDVLLRIFLDNQICLRLDLSGKFFDKSGKGNAATRKQVGLCQSENIEHGIICTICVNPKKYFELYGILRETNKKHKGVKKGTKAIDFDNYTSR